jgi:hypothetical protein
MASPAEMAQRYGPETPVADWHKRLVCSRCRSRDTDMVMTGERRREVIRRREIQTLGLAPGIQRFCGSCTSVAANLHPYSAQFCTPA